jgi:arylsulfatase A-like enzyme
MLFVDQWNYRCFGFRDHPVVQTPNLDRLKAESLDFTRTYAQNAFCLPSRVSCLTGQYLCTHREYGFDGLLEEGVPCLPRFFRENGYATCHVGKAHVNPLIDQLGFDTFVPTLPEDICFATDIHRNYQAYCRRHDLPYPNDQVHGGDGMPVPADVPENARGSTGLATTSDVPAEHSIERYTSREALDFIEGDHEGPFFLHVSFDRPHPPLTPSPEFADLYDPDQILLPDPYDEAELQRLPEHIREDVENSPDGLARSGADQIRRGLAHYYALMTHIDHEIGRIIEGLRDAGLYENTIVVFCADHGDMAGHKGLFNKYSNTIFHDDIIRVPLLVKLPGERPAEIEECAELIDVFPTLAAACGLDASDLALEGNDLTDAVAAAGNEFGEAFCESYGTKTTVRRGHKLIYYIASEEGELYDLGADPEERWNLYHEKESRDLRIEMKLAIVRKLSPEVSVERRNFIRSLFDNEGPGQVGAMDKLHKWDKAISDGGGFWVVSRGPYRLCYLPFDDDLRFEKSRPADAVPNRSAGYVACENQHQMEEMIDELLDYLSTKIRPVSLMSGSREDQDNLLLPRGPGLA